MAELSNDMVLKLAFVHPTNADRRLLERVLADTDGVTAFELAADGTLVVSLHPVHGDEGLVRALAAVGMFPVQTQHLGLVREGGTHAC